MYCSWFLSPGLGGVPIITTSKAAKPFKFIHDKDLIIKDKPIKFSEALLDLSKNYIKMGKLRESAFKYVKDNFTWEKSVNNLSKRYKQ